MSKSRKEELLKELQDLETLESEEPVNTPPAEVKSITEEDVTNNANEKVQAPKKPRTQKQQEAFQKAIETRKANEAKRKAEREAKEAEEKRILEEKLVKKAIEVKKRQLKKEKIIEQIAEEPKAVQKEKAVPIPKEPEKPKLIFKFY